MSSGQLLYIQQIRSEKLAENFSAINGISNKISAQSRVSQGIMLMAQLLPSRRNPSKGRERYISGMTNNIYARF